MRYYNLLRETASVEPGKKIGVIEEQYLLAEYKVLEGTFQEYAAIVVRYLQYKECQ